MILKWLFFGGIFRGQGGLFWGPKIDPQGALLNGLKKWLILEVEKEPKNALKIGLKME